MRLGERKVFEGVPMKAYDVIIIDFLMSFIITRNISLMIIIKTENFGQ